MFWADLLFVKLVFVFVSFCCCIWHGTKVVARRFGVLFIDGCGCSISIVFFSIACDWFVDNVLLFSFSLASYSFSDRC